MKTGLITSDTYQNHNTGDGHPEKIDRVTAVIDNFKKLDNKNLIWKKPNKFENSFLIKTHTSNYINQVDKSFPKKGYNFLDGDTVVSPGSKDASKDAVGSIITAIDGVQKKEFKMIRPRPVVICVFDKNLIKEYINLQTILRKADISAEIYPGETKLKKQMEYANKIQSPAVILYGENEIKSGKPIIRNLSSGKEQSIEIKEIVNEIKKII